MIQTLSQWKLAAADLYALALAHRCHCTKTTRNVNGEEVIEIIGRRCRRCRVLANYLALAGEAPQLPPMLCGVEAWNAWEPTNDTKK